jgi:hypothetical protein
VTDSADCSGVDDADGFALNSATAMGDGSDCIARDGSCFDATDCCGVEGEAGSGNDANGDSGTTAGVTSWSNVTGSSTSESLRVATEDDW